MGDRYFIDTNVFAYVFDPRSPEKAALAGRLIHDAKFSRRGVVSYQVVQEFFHLALRVFPTPFNIEDAVSYLETVFRPLLAVHSSSALYEQALRLRFRYQLAWYDSILIAAALEAGCGKLYSEDFQHGQRFDGLIIENPFLKRN